MRYGLEHENITQAYYGESSGDSTRTHFRFASTFVTAVFITPAARSHSLRDSADVTARRILGLASTGSCSRRRRARVIHTPCASTSSTISCSARSSAATSNDGASRGAGVVGFGGFRVADDGAADRKWIWMHHKIPVTIIMQNDKSQVLS
jgi:hypothetical protein